MADEPITEEWRPIQGYPGYEVSQLGQVRSLERLVWISEKPQQPPHFRRYPGKTLNQWLQGSAKDKAAKYCCVQIAGRTLGVHVLVCDAFVGPAPTARHQVAHWNGNTHDNTWTNLRWATTRENAMDKNRHGTMLKGEQIPSSKFTVTDIIEIRSRYHQGETPKSIASSKGVARRTIYTICSGNGWRHI